MTAAHTWFLVLAYVNLLAPSGYWAMWVLLKIDPVANILPIVTDAMSLIGSVTTVIGLISSSDPDGDGADNTADDATYIMDEITAFGATLDSFIAQIDGVIALFTWPIAAAVFLASCNSLSSYWPVVSFTTTEQGGKQPRASFWFAHIEIFFWQTLIVGGCSVALAFLDTTSLGGGTFDMEGNGLIFIVMASVYGFTVIMNFINFGAEQNWHQAMITYAATELLANPDYVNDPNGPSEEVVEEEESTMLMNDQDWSW